MAVDFGGLLRGALGQVEAAALPAVLSAVLSKTDLGGLGGIVAKLQQSGLGSQVQSWLGNGSNLPISADQLRAALGNEQVRQIAQQLGLPVDAALAALAQHLPTAVDQASPNEAVEEPEQAAADQGQANSALGRMAGLDDVGRS